MRTADVVEHFGSKAGVARALGITPPSVAEWGKVVPRLRQIQIERLTGGRLQAQSDVFTAKRRKSARAAVA